MDISDHARREMEHGGITEEEVQQCIQYGELVSKQLMKRELRYGKLLELKNRKIMVIYTLKDNQERIVTTYPIRRKRQW